MYTPLKDNIFFGGGEMYLKLEFEHKGGKISLRKFYIRKTLDLLVNFSINTTYKLLVLFIFRPSS